MPNRKVCVTIVTHNSARYVRRCLDAVLQQQDVELEIIVTDNASTDGTRKILNEFNGSIRQILNPVNRGFAEAQNQAIRAGSGSWVLTLNPDVLLSPGFIRRLLDAGESDPSAGTICGKLLSIGKGFEPLPEPRIDSTGIYFTPAMRHFDRGWGQPDNHQYDRAEHVFGATAAAALYRRKMIQDVSINGDFFDPDFFVYREDADVAWRAQILGWQCLYTPAAVAHHVRTVTSTNRRAVPPVVNMHSVKNRFLMRIKNGTSGVVLRHWAGMLGRDILVAGGTLFWEPTSLPAFWHLLRCLPKALRDRRIIMQRRRVTDDYLASWFNDEPVAYPAIARVIEIPVRTAATAAANSQKKFAPAVDLPASRSTY